MLQAHAVKKRMPNTYQPSADPSWSMAIGRATNAPPMQDVGICVSHRIGTRVPKTIPAIGDKAKATAYLIGQAIWLDHFLAHSCSNLRKRSCALGARSSGMDRAFARLAP